MAYVSAASDTERLPWLKDEGKPRAKVLPRSLLAWVTGAALLIAGGSYWYGMTAPEPAEQVIERAAPPTPSPAVRPPESRRAIPPTAEVRPAPMPAVEPVPAPPPVKISEPRPVRDSTEVRPARQSQRTAVQAKPKRRAATSPSTRAREAAGPARAARPASPTHRYWPSHQSAGAAGRMVRIGAFGSRYQAKRGWVRIARSYPGIQTMPAVVVARRSRSGQTYYRLQIGTTSQAHSAVLCQRMRIIAQSCAVVGSPPRQEARG